MAHIAEIFQIFVSPVFSISSIYIVQVRIESHIYPSTSLLMERERESDRRKRKREGKEESAGRKRVREGRERG